MIYQKANFILRLIRVVILSEKMTALCDYNSHLYMRHVPYFIPRCKVYTHADLKPGKIKNRLSLPASERYAIAK